MPDDPQATFDQLAGQFLTDPGIETGRMFGAAGLKAGGKVFAMLVKGCLVVKLPALRATALVAAQAGEFFDPGHGRLMKQWIAVPASHTPQWSELMQQARDYASPT